MLRCALWARRRRRVRQRCRIPISRRESSTLHAATSPSTYPAITGKVLRQRHSRSEENEEGQVPVVLFILNKKPTQLATLPPPPTSLSLSYYPPLPPLHCSLPRTRPTNRAHSRRYLPEPTAAHGGICSPSQSSHGRAARPLSPPLRRASASSSSICTTMCSRSGLIARNENKSRSGSSSALFPESEGCNFVPKTKHVSAVTSHLRSVPATAVTRSLGH